MNEGSLLTFELHCAEALCVLQSVTMLSCSVNQNANTNLLLSLCGVNLQEFSRFSSVYDVTFNYSVTVRRTF